MSGADREVIEKEGYKRSLMRVQTARREQRM